MDTFTSLAPQTRDLGGLEVRRLLPARSHKLVGPFIFFDHMGPARLAPGAGIDVRPHPHIGLATVTYLFEGALVHRDSLGTLQRIEPGAVNWMSAGRGIVHSERSPDEARRAGAHLHGIQTWVALPRAHEQDDPFFSHHPRASVPLITSPGVDMHLIAGTAFGRTAPTSACWPMFYLAVEMEAGSTLELPLEYEERGVYVVAGVVAAGGATLPLHHLALMRADAEVRISAHAPARLMLLGGAPIDGERHIWWNFVASSPALMEEAAERWRAGNFPPVPGETEYIPLPEYRGSHTTFTP